MTHPTPIRSGMSVLPVSCQASVQPASLKNFRGTSEPCIGRQVSVLSDSLFMLCIIWQIKGYY